MNDWRCDGVRWREGRPGLAWASRRAGERVRRLRLGDVLAFGVVGARRCVGVWRGGRRTWCPAAAVVADGRHSARCASCEALDRSSSVAADTALDDPRPFALYLAWFGPGLLKLGITAAERGQARLLEQGALAHTWLGQGPLAGVRRAEAALGTAVGVPDRVPARAKHAARAAGWDPEAAAGELAGAHRAATACAAWPASVAPRPFRAVGHWTAYGIDPARTRCPRAEVTALTDGDTVRGTLDAVVGPYAQLIDAQGPLLLDLRLLAGRALAAAPVDATTTAACRATRRPQTGLF